MMAKTMGLPSVSIPGFLPVLAQRLGIERYKTKRTKKKKDKM
jgi:hypothetical protein